MNLTLEFSSFSVATSIILRIATAIIFLLFVIPLQWKEAKVKNGLAVLRKQLLLSSLSLFVINTLGLILYILRAVLSSQWFRVLSDTLAIVNSIGFLLVAFITYQIYHQHYNDIQRRNHEILEKIESGELILVKKRKRGGK